MMKSKTIRVWAVIVTECSHYTDFIEEVYYSWAWPARDQDPYVRYAFFETRFDARLWSKNNQQECRKRVVSFYIPAPKGKK